MAPRAGQVPRHLSSLYPALWDTPTTPTLPTYLHSQGAKSVAEAGGLGQGVEEEAGAVVEAGGAAGAGGVPGAGEAA